MGAYAKGGFTGNFTAQIGDETLYNAKAQSGAICAALIAAVQRNEVIKNALYVIFCDANSSVRYIKYKRAVFLGIGCLKLHRTTRRKLDRVAQQIDDDLLSGSLIRQKELLAGLWLNQLNRCLIVAGEGLQRCHQTVGQCCNIARCWLWGLALFGAFNSQNIVNMPQQDIARCQCGANVRPLFAVQLTAFQHLQRRQHTVQGRAHFMAHHCKEPRAFTVCAKCIITAADQLGLLCLLVSNIAHIADKERMRPRMGDGGGHFRRKGVTVLVHHVELLAAFFGKGRFAGLPVVRHGGIKHFAFFGGQQQVKEALADCLVTGKAKHVFGRLAEVDDDCVFISHNYPIKRAAQGC